MPGLPPWLAYQPLSQIHLPHCGLRNLLLVN
jgi:hypothetical protein